jgi:hypothetical protein
LIVVLGLTGKSTQIGRGIVSPKRKGGRHGANLFAQSESELDLERIPHGSGEQTVGIRRLFLLGSIGNGRTWNLQVRDCDPHFCQKRLKTRRRPVGIELGASKKRYANRASADSRGHMAGGR